MANMALLKQDWGSALVKTEGPGFNSSCSLTGKLLRQQQPWESFSMTLNIWRALCNKAQKAQTITMPRHCIQPWQGMKGLKMVCQSYLVWHDAWIDRCIKRHQYTQVFRLCVCLANMLCFLLEHLGPSKHTGVQCKYRGKMGSAMNTAQTTALIINDNTFAQHKGVSN